MAGSYLRFNYNVRASKSVERKMILEVLKDLCPPSVIKDYQYIGFGSVFYTDFRLFHKDLNICDMVCIEREVDDKDRFEFNKPYKCINLMMGDSFEILPKLDWAKKSITWLDYEDKLLPTMFDDIRTVISNAKNKSFFIVTCNATPSSYRKEATISEVELYKFREDFKGIANINLTASDFTAKKIIPLLHNMFTSFIEDILNQKNAGISSENQLVFKQIFNLRYQDNSAMYTFGGVFISPNEVNQIEDDVKKYDFVRTGVPIYEIDVPKLTNREIDGLNSHLPNSLTTFIAETTAFIPENFRKAYFKLYKHFPNYMEIKDF